MTQCWELSTELWVESHEDPTANSNRKAYIINVMFSYDYQCIRLGPRFAELRLSTIYGLVGAISASGSEVGTVHGLQDPCEVTDEIARIPARRIRMFSVVPGNI